MVLLLNATTSKVLYTLIGTLVKIAHHIGAESTTEKLLPYLDQFFNHYGHLHPSNDSSSGVEEIYTPHMAAMLYYQFAILIGKNRLDSEISNVQQIQSVMKKDKRLNMYYENLSNDDFVPVQKTKQPPSKIKHETPSLKSKLESASKEELRIKNPALDPNWLLNTIAESGPENKWTSSVYHLQKAHSNIVKCIAINDCESKIVTGSYDTTVKLWSLDKTLRNEAIYQKHKRPVHSASFVNQGTLISSCDQTLHVWDPNTLENTLLIQHQISFKALECVDNGSLLAVSTNSNRFWFVF